VDCDAEISGVQDMEKSITKKRIKYALATIAIFLIELLIALFVRDRFIRPYVGDMLVVVLIYSSLCVPSVITGNMTIVGTMTGVAK